jgi:REP element-mobilizing transposase RayT
MKNQKSLFEFSDDKSTERRYARRVHGGVSKKPARKLERPLSRKGFIHLILKSEKAKGTLSFLKRDNDIAVRNILREKAKKFGVVIADFANVGNHLHIKIKVQSRESFQKFLKAVTCLIARKITGARRGKPFGKFWQALAFTRIITSRLEELRLRGYFEGNRREAKQGHAAREDFLAEYEAWIRRLKKQRPP